MYAWHISSMHSFVLAKFCFSGQTPSSIPIMLVSSTKRISWNLKLSAALFPLVRFMSLRGNEKPGANCRSMPTFDCFLFFHSFLMAILIDIDWWKRPERWKFLLKIQKEVSVVNCFLQVSYVRRTVTCSPPKNRWSVRLIRYFPFLTAG